MRQIILGRRPLNLDMRVYWDDLRQYDLTCPVPISIQVQLRPAPSQAGVHRWVVSVGEWIHDLKHTRIVLGNRYG